MTYPVAVDKCDLSNITSRLMNIKRMTVSDKGGVSVSFTISLKQQMVSTRITRILCSLKRTITISATRLRRMTKANGM